MVRAICKVQLKVCSSYSLDATLGLNEAMAMANRVHWYDQVLTMAVGFEFEGQRKTGRLMRQRKRRVEEESVKVGLSREDALCLSVWIAGVSQIATRLR